MLSLGIDPLDRNGTGEISLDRLAPMTSAWLREEVDWQQFARTLQAHTEAARLRASSPHKLSVSRVRL